MNNFFYKNKNEKTLFMRIKFRKINLERKKIFKLKKMVLSKVKSKKCGPRMEH